MDQPSPHPDRSRLEVDVRTVVVGATSLLIALMGLMAFTFWWYGSRLTQAERKANGIASTANGLALSVNQLRDQLASKGVTPVVGPVPVPVVGATGAVGTAGSNGGRGDPGSQGQPGQAGSQGSQGVQGQQGVTGAAGTSGTPGTPGAPGVNGTAGTTGPAGPAGKDGTDGAPGPKGDKGDKGDPPASFDFTIGAVTYHCTDPDHDGAYTCAAA